jgi:hypothetical protein
VSPTGALYGIQTYNSNGVTVQYAYKFSFVTGKWNILDPTFQPVDIKFDKLGNIFFLDTLGNVVSNQYKQLPILTGVRDFEVTVGKNIYAIGQTAAASSNAYTTNVFDSNGAYPYKQFPNTQYNKLILVNDVPVFVGANKVTIGYGNQCVTDISAGVDGTVWALDCNNDGTGNFNIIKWDPFLTQWYIVPG